MKCNSQAEQSLPDYKQKGVPRLLKFGTISENEKGDLVFEKFSIDMADTNKSAGIVLVRCCIARLEQALSEIEKAESTYTYHAQIYLEGQADLLKITQEVTHPPIQSERELELLAVIEQMRVKCN